MPLPPRPCPGFASPVTAIASVRSQENWSAYVVRLVRNVQKAVRQHSAIDKLRFLLYPSGLTAESIKEIQADDAGVIWLG